MHTARWNAAATLTCVALLVGACGDDDGLLGDLGLLSDGVRQDGEPLDAGMDLPVGDFGPGPGSKFDRFCKGTPWYARTAAASVEKLGGKYAGSYSAAGGKPFAAWTLETIKVIPRHPFRVRKIRLDFAKGSGKARVRLMTTFGRSVPGPFPQITSEKYDLIKPRVVEIKDAKPDSWTEIDVSSENLFLEPTRHYMIVYQHLAKEPLLAIEEAPAGEQSRSYLFLPTSIQTWAIGGQGKVMNYRMELTGDYFCSWSDKDHWFGEDKTQPFATEATVRVAFAELNGDGHDDLILSSTWTRNGKSEPHPKAYLGDGKGGFSKPAADPFSGVRAAGMLVFGDLDNDGDRDAVAFPYVTADRDGDTYLVQPFDGSKPDCDDADKAVYPGNTEVAGNGKDDDCDGVVDDGKSTADADKDGKSVAAGDCDDTQATVYPGAKELLDGRDNDCDKKVDEDFANQVLLNDGKGKFTEKVAAGVEATDPSTAAALADADGDGKLDLYWGNWLIKYPTDPSVPDRYFTGKGDGTFSDSFSKAGLTLKNPYSVYGVRWLDYNNDGHQDLYVSNYHLYPNQLWENQGDGTFKEVAEKRGVAFDAIPSSNALLTGGHSYGMDFGDVDSDGDMDMWITNLSHPRTRPWSDPSVFAVNKGAAGGYAFEDKTAAAGFIYDEGDVNVAFADYDNDGDLDLALATLYGGHYSKVYRNEGNGKFTDVTYEARAAVHDAVSVVWADTDADGDLDLFITGRAANSKRVHYFKNRVGSKNAWVELLLEGKTSNRDAIGARVTLKAGGKTQLRDARGGGGGHSNVQQPRTVHFGLWAATKIDSLTVRWPGGKTETITGAAPRGRYKIVQGSGVAVALK